MLKSWFNSVLVETPNLIDISSSIRLRICGSHGEKAPGNFLRAFEYYNLWPLHDQVRQILSNPKLSKSLRPDDPKEDSELAQVLYGSED